MSKLTYQQRDTQNTRIPVGQRRTSGGKVLEDNRAAFAAKHLKQTETAQRVEEEDELLKEESGAAQLAKKDEEEAAQAKFFDQAPSVQREENASKPNNTGLPDKLKNGIESLSGLSMDGVKVHYNSSQPAQLNALAYAQGMDIHVGPGQEKHLPHEAWHVVQQAQGRVKPTAQMKNQIPVNDDKGLEREADTMGEKILQQSIIPTPMPHRKLNTVHTPDNPYIAPSASAPVQRVPFDQYIGNLKSHAYYYIRINNKDVLAQYLDTDDTVRGLGYWFNDLGRGDKASWIWEQPIGQSRFYLLGTDKEDISEVESPQQYLSNRGFAEFNIDWKGQLATNAKTKHEDFAYEKVNDSKICWHPIIGWKEIKTHTRNISIFPPLGTDQIIENSIAYVDDKSICFLFEPDQTEGYQFKGAKADIITLLASYYVYLNKAAAPRSGKARAAADIEDGEDRSPAPDEAAYAAATKDMNSSVGKQSLDANSTIDITSTPNTSKVEITHTGPWKKGDRGSGQSDAMGGQNAKNYLVDQHPNPLNKSKEALRLELGGRYEWLHVVGSSLGGINVKENLVAGSYDANTKMIALEHRVARWGARDYSGEHAPSPWTPISIIGVAETYPNTRKGKSISLTISHGSKKLVSGNYDVEDKKVITKSQYLAEEKRVDEEIKSNS